MVARLKLKEIDGRAPPGVSTANAAALLRIAARKGGWVPWRPPNQVLATSSTVATPSNCGDLLKPPATKPAPNGVGGRVSRPGTVVTLGDATMDDPHPSSYGESPRRRSRDLTGVGS